MESISVKVGFAKCGGGTDIPHRITRLDKMLKLLLLAALASVTWGRNYPPYNIKDDDYGLVDDETPNRHKAPILQAHITYDEDDEQDLVAEAYPDENDDYGFKPVVYEGKSDSSSRKRADGKQGLYKGSDISEEIRLSRKNQNEEDIQVKKQQSLYGKRLPIPQPQGTYKGSDEIPKALSAYGTRNAKDYSLGVDDRNLGGYGVSEVYGNHGPTSPIYQQGVSVDIENQKPCTYPKSNILLGVKGGKISYEPVETGLKQGAYGIEGGYMGYGKYKAIMLGGVDYAGVTYAGPSPQVYHGVKGGSGSHSQDSGYGGVKGGSGYQSHGLGYGGIKGGNGAQTHESGYGEIKGGSGSQSYDAGYGRIKGGSDYQSHGSEYGGAKESGYGGIKGGSGSQSHDSGYGGIKGGSGYQSHGTEYGGVKESGYGGIKGGSGSQSHEAGYGGIKGGSSYQSQVSGYGGVKESSYGGIKGGIGSQIHGPSYGAVKGGIGYQSHESGYGGVKGGSGSDSQESGYSGIKGGIGSQSHGSSYGGIKGGGGAQLYESGYGGIKGGSASKSLASGYGGTKGGSGVQSHGSGYGGVKGGSGSQSHAFGYGGIKGGTGSHKYGSEDSSEYEAGNVKLNSGSHKLGSDAISGSGYHSSSGSPIYGSGLSSTSGYGSGVHDYGKASGYDRVKGGSGLQSQGPSLIVSDYHGVKGGANTGSYGKPGHYDDLKRGYGQGETSGTGNYGYNKDIKGNAPHSSLYSEGQIRPNAPTGNYGTYDKQGSYGAPEKIESSYYDSSKNFGTGNEESYYKNGNSGYTDKPSYGSIYQGSDRVSMPGGPRYYQNNVGSRYNAPSGPQTGYDVSKGYSPVTDHLRAGSPTYQHGVAGSSALQETPLRRPSYSPQLSSVGPQFDYGIPTGHHGAPQSSGVSAYGQNVGGYQTGSPSGVTSSYGQSGAPAASRYNPGSSPLPVHGSPSYGNNGGLSLPGPSYPNHARPYSPSNSGSYTGGTGLAPLGTGISNLPSSTYQVSADRGHRQSGPGASSINSAPATYGSYGSGPSAAIAGPVYGQGITPSRSVVSGGHDIYALPRPSSVPRSSNQQVGGDNGRVLHLPSYQNVGDVSHNNLPPYAGNRAVGQSAPGGQSQPGYGSRLGGSALPGSAAGSADKAYGPGNLVSSGYPSGRPSSGGYGGRQGSAGGSSDSSRGGSKDGEENENSEPKPYHFEFVAPDTHPESTHFRKESGDGLGNVSGSYGYKDETGLYRHVDYEANKDGFKANVKTNEPGTENENPADVHFEVEKTVDPRY